MRKQFPKNSRGSALVLLTTLLATVLIPVVGLAVDGTIMWMLKVKLVAAADAGALAGARSLSAGMDLVSQKSSAESTAIKYLQANFPTGFWNTTDLHATATAAETGYKTRTVTVTVDVTSPTYFMQVIGRKTQVIAAKAQSSRRDVNVELVLDRSSSMSGAMDAMLAAADNFVSQFAEGRDNVGLIVFGGAALVAYPNPSTNGPDNKFKSSNPNVSALIDKTINGGNTGTAQALHLAYNELQKRNEPGALNLIVLFTDGLPNGIVADFNDSTPTGYTKGGAAIYGNNFLHGPNTDGLARTCTHAQDKNYPMVGFMSQTNGFTSASNGHDTNAVKHIDGSAVDVINEGPLTGEVSKGCHYNPTYNTSYKNGDLVRQDLFKLVPADLYGNALDHGYVTADLTNAVKVPADFGKAAMNAADNQVMTMRKDANIRPVLYAIGYEGGSEKPDENWMMRIANDPSSTDFDKTYPAGLYIKAPTTDQLVGAFNRVASEIMRLAY